MTLPDITIERGIPLPETTSQRGRQARYPWRKMAVGDSFHAPRVSRNAIRTTANYHQEKLGFTFRVEPDGDGFRVWRTA